MRTLQEDLVEALELLGPDVEIPEWLQDLRACTRCWEPVFNHEPARVTLLGTQHINCPTKGDADAAARMIAAFRRANT